LDAVFHVVDQHGKKVTDQGLITYIQEVSLQYSQAGFFEGFVRSAQHENEVIPLRCDTIASTGCTIAVAL
jgi:hypothetical protein